MTRLFVLNGANLGALGTLTLKDIEGGMHERFPGVEFEIRQTDYEGEMVGYVREAGSSEGVVVNPGAWTHYSYALEAVDAVVAGMGPYGYEAAVGYTLGRRDGPEAQG